jgi:ketosteroid isomerase-like protein
MPKLSADDKLEIQELCAAYAHLVDAGDFASFVARVFTEDGVNDFGDIGYPAVKGREAIRRDYARMNHPIAHLTTNTLFEKIVSEDEAEVVTKYFVIGADADAHSNYSTVLTGYFRDRVVRTAEGWRIKHRVLKRLRVPLGVAKA